jgi:hypothetical protein
MEKINQFSIQRFLLLIKRNAVLNLKTWLIGFGAISGLLILIAQLQAYQSGGILDINGIAITGLTFIFIGGYLVTSMAYNEIHTPARSQFFLTLPATNAEKLFSHWFLTSFLYVVVATLVLFVILLLSSLLTTLIYGSGIELFRPFSSGNIRLMGIYMVTQSVFFLGAIYFRKNNFLKTVLTAFVLMMLLSTWAGLSMWITFGTGHFSPDNESLSPAFVNYMENVVPSIAKIVFWGILTPFFLTVSYFTLKEREV